MALNIWKKLLTVLFVACLFINLVPGVSATGKGWLDFSELERQIAIANGLNSYDYTTESWEKLEEALEAGNNLRKGAHDQRKINETAQNIAKALANLVKMDYSPLDTALAAVYSKMEENPELHDVWTRLMEAVEEYRPLLVSGNQEAVNEAAAHLNALMEELSQCGGASVKPEVVIQEVEVEVLPTSDYCNIPMHRTWPVLFVISAVLNVALIAALIYIISKKSNTVDNTPLVNYDIDDDMDL